MRAWGGCCGVSGWASGAEFPLLGWTNAVIVAGARRPVGLKEASECAGCVVLDCAGRGFGVCFLGRGSGFGFFGDGEGLCGLGGRKVPIGRVRFGLVPTVFMGHV